MKKILSLKYKIVKIEPLIVESEGFPSQENVCALVKITKASLTDTEYENATYSKLNTDSSVKKIDHISQQFFEIDKCKFYFNKQLKFDHELIKKITALKFKIVKIEPLIVESEGFPKQENLFKITEILRGIVANKDKQESNSYSDVHKIDSSLKSNDPLESHACQDVDEIASILDKVHINENDGIEFQSGHFGRENITNPQKTDDVYDQNVVNFKDNFSLASKKIDGVNYQGASSELVEDQSSSSSDDKCQIESRKKPLHCKRVQLDDDKQIPENQSKINNRAQEAVVEQNKNSKFNSSKELTTDVGKKDISVDRQKKVSSSDKVKKENKITVMPMGQSTYVLPAVERIGAYLKKTNAASNTLTSENVCCTSREKELSSLETLEDERSSFKRLSSVKQEINSVKNEKSLSLKDEDVEMCSDDTDTESETAETCVPIEIKKYRAARVFYKDTKYCAYLTSAVPSNNDYAIKFQTKDKKAQKFLIELEYFEIYEIDSTDLTFNLSDYVEKHFSHIKIECFEKNIFTLMGQKDELLSAQKDILSFIDYNKTTTTKDKLAYQRNKEKGLQSLEKFDDTREKQNQPQREVKTQLSNKKDTNKQKNDPIPITDSDKGTSSDEAEVEKYLTIEERKFEAVKHFYKDNVYMSFLKSPVKIKGCYELIISSKDKKAKDFITAIKDFKIFEIDVKENVNRIISCLEREHPNTKVTCFGKNILTLMGHKDHFQSAKSKLLSLIGNNDEDTTWSAKMEGDTATQGGGEAKSWGMGNKQSQSEKFSDSEDSKTLQSVKLNHREQDKDPLRKESSKQQVGSRIIDRSFYHPVFVGCSKLKVVVIRDDITLQKVDCIVNAASKSLKQSGGVAGAISKAAGPSMQQECDRYISAHKAVSVTDIFVSDAGHLSAKKIIHAVGPKWDDYSERDKKHCEEDLRRTVLRCLLEASKRKMSSIALPAISSGRPNNLLDLFFKFLCLLLWL